jgi:hypothetical protein
MKQLSINQKVITPIGEGTFQGWYRAVMSTVESCLVRLPVNDETAKHLQDPRCVTPRATKQALFQFPPSELGGGLIVDLVLLALVIGGILLLGSCLGWPW